MMSRRERQQIERRKEILDTALRLFEEKGYPDTSMDEIASAADIARATLYNHFPSKADVVLALTASIAEDWLQQGAKKLESSGSATAAIMDLLVSAATWFDTHSAAAPCFYHAMREIMSKHTLESAPPTLMPHDWVALAQTQNELTSELPTDLVMILLEGVLKHHMIDLLRGSAKGKMAPSVAHQLDILFKRLAP